MVSVQNNVLSNDNLSSIVSFNNQTVLVIEFHLRPLNILYSFVNLLMQIFLKECFYAQESNTTSPVEKKTPKVPAKPKKLLSKKLSPPATPSREDVPTNQTSQSQTPTPPKVSLTPKVVLKGIKPKLSSGPKFKFTPSRNGVPGQIQKSYSKGKLE